MNESLEDPILDYANSREAMRTIQEWYVKKSWRGMEREPSEPHFVNDESPEVIIVTVNFLFLFNAEKKN